MISLYNDIAFVMMTHTLTYTHAHTHTVQYCEFEALHKIHILSLNAYGLVVALEVSYKCTNGHCLLSQQVIIKC